MSRMKNDLSLPHNHHFLPRTVMACRHKSGMAEPFPVQPFPAQIFPDLDLIGFTISIPSFWGEVKYVSGPNQNVKCDVKARF
jgi:hypothetical protein